MLPFWLAYKYTPPLLKVAFLMRSTVMLALRNWWWLPLELVKISTPSRPIGICDDWGVQSWNKSWSQWVTHRTHLTMHYTGTAWYPGMAHLPASPHLLTDFRSKNGIQRWNNRVSERHCLLSWKGNEKNERKRNDTSVRTIVLKNVFRETPVFA